MPYLLFTLTTFMFSLANAQSYTNSTPNSTASNVLTAGVMIANQAVRKALEPKTTARPTQDLAQGTCTLANAQGTRLPCPRLRFRVLNAGGVEIGNVETTIDGLLAFALPDRQTYQLVPPASVEGPAVSVRRGSRFDIRLNEKMAR